MCIVLYKCSPSGSLCDCPFHCLNQKGAALILTQRAEKEIFFPSFCLVDSSEPPFFNPAYVHKGDFE